MDKPVQDKSKLKNPYLIAVVALSVVFLLAAILYFFNNQQQKNSYISGLDLESYESIQSKGTNPDILVAGEEGLMRVEAMAVEAKNLGIYPTQEEIEKRATEKYGSLEENTKRLFLSCSPKLPMLFPAPKDSK